MAIVILLTFIFIVLPITLITIILAGFIKLSIILICKIISFIAWKA